MSEKRVKVEREVAEREIKVEREQILKPEFNITGVFPEGTKEITENGEYDIELFKSANVAVPLPEGTINITKNGTHNVKDYETAEVAVPVVDLNDYFMDTTTRASLATLIKRIPGFNISGITSAANMFSRSSYPNLESVEILSFGSLSNLTSLFNNSAATNIVLPHDVAPTSLDQFMSSCDVVEVDASGWDTKSVSTFQYAFSSSRNIKRINMSGWTNPNSRATNEMFYNCVALETLIIDSPEVFTLKSSSSLNFMKASCNIYVPDDLVESYKAADVWVGRAAYIKPLSELPEEYRS